MIRPPQQANLYRFTYVVAIALEDVSSGIFTLGAAVVLELQEVLNMPPTK